MVKRTNTPDVREKSYSEKLLDPRWQRRRLEILDRDSWECTNCGNGKKTLHVHHRSYEYNRLPWEYEDDDLTTLCESCHESAGKGQKALKAIAQKIGREISDGSDAIALLAAINQHGFENSAPYEFLMLSEWMVKDKEFSSLCWDLMVSYAQRKADEQ